jgi:hypothetical protein
MLASYSFSNDKNEKSSCLRCQKPRVKIDEVAKIFIYIGLKSEKSVFCKVSTVER